MKTVYFGGTFSGKKYNELIEERESLRAKLALLDISILDPLRDKLPIKGKEDIKMENYCIEQEFRPNSIVHRDLADIRKADIVILVMSSPSIGSSCELMFASLHGKITIVLTDNPLVLNHPWVQSIATEVVQTEEEILSQIIFYL